MFNDTAMTRGQSHAPRWPGADLFKPIGAPTELRIEVNKCRRSTKGDAKEGGALDRPYVVPPRGQGWHTHSHYYIILRRVKTHSMVHVTNLKTPRE